MTHTAITDKLKTLHKSDIFFGPQGFALATTAQALVQAQQGFSCYPDGSPLPSSEAGNWQDNWLVIATDTELGDPYFVDTTDEQQAVYTAILTDDGWQKQLVSNSLNSFVACLQLLAKTSNQEQATIFPDENTLADKNQLTTLMKKLIKLSSGESFWRLFFECYYDWLEDLDDE